MVDWRWSQGRSWLDVDTDTRSFTQLSRSGAASYTQQAPAQQPAGPLANGKLDTRGPLRLGRLSNRGPVRTLGDLLLSLTSTS